MDRDETPIGGLKNPMQPTRQLFLVTVIMDISALLLAFALSPAFSVGILLYIIASRAYSSRSIRLKKYPVTGFLTVFVFQGALVFLLCYETVRTSAGDGFPFLPCLIASLLIGALYPLTQVYQHQADKKDGVVTLSCLLGTKGTFLFSALLFLSATFLLYLRFKQMDQLNYFSLYLLIMLPVVLFFLYWTVIVWKNEEAASFRNSLWMNVLSTVCTALFFLTLIAMKH